MEGFSYPEFRLFIVINSTVKGGGGGLREGRAARAGTERQTQQHVARILMRVTAVSTQDDLISTRRWQQSSEL